MGHYVKHPCHAYCKPEAVLLTGPVNSDWLPHSDVQPVLAGAPLNVPLLSDPIPSINTRQKVNRKLRMSWIKSFLTEQGVRFKPFLKSHWNTSEPNATPQNFFKFKIDSRLRFHKWPTKRVIMQRQKHTCTGLPAHDAVFNFFDDKSKILKVSNANLHSLVFKVNKSTQIGSKSSTSRHNFQRYHLSSINICVKIFSSMIRPLILYLHENTRGYPCTYSSYALLSKRKRYWVRVTLYTSWASYIITLVLGLQRLCKGRNL